MDLSQSFVRYWKKRKALDVGHRGMGVSYKKTALVKENTIGSLNSAANFGADYVEFDVQLSKDLVPVLFHDFHLCLAVHQRDSEPEDYILHEICVNDLTLEDMNKLKLYLEKNITVHNPKCLHESDDVSQKSFPTLNEVFPSVDPHLGFNIEIKYPMCTSDGVWESEKRVERNLYVDKILEQVFNHATEDRRIVFSSFEPYICLMLKLKQNKYPVMFLTQGETKRYAPFTEIMTSSSQMAVDFAFANEFLGVCFHSEPLLRDPNAFYLAAKNYLVSFVWGEDLNDVENIQYFKTIGFDGIIFDRINEHLPGKRNVFLVEKELSRSVSV
jgi:glycerophosphocholine phosphodiesterase GPCPD1